MEEDSETSGASLGGDGDTGEPLSLSVRQFIAARVSEITSLTAQIGKLVGINGQLIELRIRYTSLGK